MAARTPSTPPGHAVLVRNPRARRALDRAALAAAARPLERAGWVVEIVDTRGPGDGAALARDAVARGADVVVACGGDGTVSEVAHGLAGGDAALAVLASGTANVWAREARVPRDPGRALALVANGRRVRIDLGEATIGDAIPRRFLLMCGAGLDANVVGAVESRPRLKRALGRLSFLVAGAPALAAVRAVPVSLTHDGGRVERSLMLAVAGNTRLYGGMVRLTNGARINDGQLDIVTFSADEQSLPARLVRYVALAADALRGGLATRRARGVDYIRTGEALITPARALPIHVDGEAIGVAGPSAPLRLRSLPSALTAVIGPQPNPLLAEV